MEKIILAIHGLRNKPARELLTKWWKRSIEEGFEAIDLEVPAFEFEMAYWAHVMHPHPQDPGVADEKDPRFLCEHYAEGTHFGPRDPGPLRQKVQHEIRKQVMHLIAGKSGFMNVESVSDLILKRMFEELNIYYHENLPDGKGGHRPARDLVQGELISLLKKHAGKEILLVAHSMGSIVAYDVLMENRAGVPVNTLITLGAPLGFPVVMRKIRESLGWDMESTGPLPTPETIRKRWLNLSDLEDVTCLNYNLRKHYQKGVRRVRPFDQIVFNNYEYKGSPNPHKSYGYLRTAAFTQAVDDFLSMEDKDFWVRLKGLFGGS